MVVPMAFKAPSPVNRRLGPAAVFAAQTLAPPSAAGIASFLASWKEKSLARGFAGAAGGGARPNQKKG
jgi:hypothetical protein